MQPAWGAPPPASPPPWWPSGPAPYGSFLPQPGVPSRGPLVTGAVGHFIGAGVAVPSALVFGFFSFRFFDFFGGLGFPFLFGVLIFVALLLESFGMFGLGRQYRSALAYGVFAYGLAVAVVWLVAITLVAVSRPGFFFIGDLILLIAFVLVGVCFILQGATFIVLRNRFGAPGPSVAAGVLLIVAGSFLCSVIGSSVGFFVLVAGSVLGGAVLVGATRSQPWGMSAPAVVPPG